MNSQIKQVSLVYLTQRYMWLIVVLFSLVVIPNILAAMTPDRSVGPAIMFSLGMPMLALIPFLVGLVKTQFCHWRARLMPRFMPAHLIVVTGILLVFFVFYPLLLAGLSRSDPLGLIALGVAIGVPAIWGAHLNRFWLMLISLAAFYSVMTSWGANWWIVEAAEHRAEHALIVAAGIGCVVAWLWRLVHLHEEMDDYQNIYQAMMARRTGSEAIEQRRIVAVQVRRSRFVSMISDWWHRRIGGYHGSRPLRLARLLRYGFNAFPIEVNAFIMLAMFVALGVFLSKLSNVSSGGGSFGALWFFVMFGILIPGQMAGEFLVQRRPRLTFEMLLPLSRRQLISGLFTASVYNAIVFWLIMNGGLGIVAVLAETPLSPSTVTMFVLMSATATFVSLALGLRVAIWSSMAKRFAIIWLSWMLLIAPIFGLWVARSEIGDAPLLIGVGIMLAIGAWLFSNARQTWLNLELG
jgi:hypothetical protein